MEKIWRATNGEMFHGSCFEDDESRDSYTAIAVGDLADDDECASCGGVFLSGMSPLDDDDDEKEQEDEMA